MTPLVAVIAVVLLLVVVTNAVGRARAGRKSVRSHHRALDTLGHISTQRPDAMTAVPPTGLARQAHVRVVPSGAEQPPEPPRPTTGRWRAAPGRGTAPQSRTPSEALHDRGDAGDPTPFPGPTDQGDDLRPAEEPAESTGTAERQPHADGWESDGTETATTADAGPTTADVWTASAPYAPTHEQGPTATPVDEAERPTGEVAVVAIEPHLPADVAAAGPEAGALPDVWGVGTDGGLRDELAEVHPWVIPDLVPGSERGSAALADLAAWARAEAPTGGAGGPDALPAQAGTESATAHLDDPPSTVPTGEHPAVPAGDPTVDGDQIEAGDPTVDGDQIEAGVPVVPPSTDSAHTDPIDTDPIDTDPRDTDLIDTISTETDSTEMVSTEMVSTEMVSTETDLAGTGSAETTPPPPVALVASTPSSPRSPIRPRSAGTDLAALARVPGAHAHRSHRRGSRRRVVLPLVLLLVVGAAAGGTVSVLDRHHTRTPSAAPVVHHRHRAAAPTTITTAPPTTVAAPVKLVSSSNGTSVYEVTGTKPITVTASGLCWIEIRRTDAAGALIYSQTMASGTKETVTGPVWVRLGNPTAVAVTVGGAVVSPPVTSGEPYDLQFQ